MSKRRAPPMSPKERNTARDIRRALAQKKPVTKEARSWLADYVERVKRNRGSRAVRIIAGPELEAPPATPPPAKPPKAAPPPPEPPPEPQDDDEDDDEDDDDEDDDESGEHARPEPEPSARPRKRLSFVEDEQRDAPGDGPQRPPEREGCGRTGCPACTGLAGSYVCSGKRVWEPLDDDEAEALADGALTAVGFLAGGLGWLLRGRQGPMVIVDPTPRQSERMSKAARKMAHRRANWIGEYSDLVLGVPTVVSYSKRAFAGPTAEEVKERQAQRRAFWESDDDEQQERKPDAAAAE